MDFREGVICVAPDDVTLVAGVPGVGVPVLALRMKPYVFVSFSCTESVCLAFDLTVFYQNLFKVLKGDLLQLSGSANAYWIDFDLLNYSEKLETRQVLATQFPMLSTHIGRMNVPQLRNHYQVAVGIPAEDFRLLIMKLSQFGELVYASITATAVEFSVRNEKVIFKQPKQCTIKGAVGEDPVVLVFNLIHSDAIVNASILSNVVLLFGQTQTHGFSVALKFFFGRLGSLEYYFR
ncbi:proliferating cell nuclear antigen-like [Prunus persica]|nr:proliferating cell nuclear antigen-like [Prunus persica]